MIKKIRETLYNQSFTEQELQEYLKIYQELTDLDYIQQMLQEENYQNHKIFETFAEKNFLDPRQIIKELALQREKEKRFLNGKNRKKRSMAIFFPISKIWIRI